MKYSEISHFSHPPEHKLKFEYSEFSFKCDGCNEVGIRSRYKCSICDYDLHVHCAVDLPRVLQEMLVPDSGRLCRGILRVHATRARRTWRIRVPLQILRLRSPPLLCKAADGA
ncbi:hypothetical protein K1719_030351 [Acacia pycnantha]|nr:hypothetical protein K1719_030351 [Acacia pycnantha]